CGVSGLHRDVFGERTTHLNREKASNIIGLRCWPQKYPRQAAAELNSPRRAGNAGQSSRKALRPVGRRASAESQSGRQDAVRTFYRERPGTAGDNPCHPLRRTLTILALFRTFSVHALDSIYNFGADFPARFFGAASAAGSFRRWRSPIRSMCFLPHWQSGVSASLSPSAVGVSEYSTRGGISG